MSPRARRLASELGIDVRGLRASGPSDSIVGDDVLALAESSASAELDSAENAGDNRFDAMRRRTGDLMARSKRDIPHFYVSTDIDLSRALARLAALNETRPVVDRVLPAAVLLRAAVVALETVPDLNGHWVGGFRPSRSVHLGVAVSLRGGGLIAPTIPDAGRLGLVGLMVALRELVNRARSGRLKSSDLVAPTITVTNLGENGVDRVLGVIYPPQVALVGFGRISERPWAEAGLVAARPAVTASLSADHRVADGQVAARFLNALAKFLRDADLCEGVVR